MCKQFVWDLRYIDAMVFMDIETDSGQSGLDDRYYYTNDANMNVTSVVDEQPCRVGKFSRSEVLPTIEEHGGMIANRPGKWWATSCPPYTADWPEGGRKASRVGWASSREAGSCPPSKNMVE
jgi:hypothetical protein